MRLLAVFLFTLIFLQTVPALAQGFDDQSMNAAPAKDPMEEFKDVGTGLLLPPAEDPNAAAEKDKKDSPAILAPGQEEERLLTYDEVIKGYKKGEFTKIVPSLEVMARNNQPAGLEILGIMYKNGQGVTKDPKKGFEYLLKAAEENRPLSQHHVGVMYFKGDGIETPDPVKSLMWLHIAIAHYQDGPEKARAVRDRDSVFVKLTRREKDRAKEMAHQWLDKRGEAHLLDM